MLPAFNSKGLLPQGNYSITFALLRRSFLVCGREGENGGGCISGWDNLWREHLVDNLEVLSAPLRKIGVGELWIAGSFVENKAHPNDLDGFFECHPSKFLLGEWERELVEASGFDGASEVWTWNEVAKTATADGLTRKLPMWHRYRVELFPHYSGLLTGLSDRYGRSLSIPAAFRLSRELMPKGIIRLDLK